MPLCLCGGALVCSRRPLALSAAASPDPHACAAQLPKEGRCIFLGWEPSGAALAAVQDHGGAFLWFPSKPDCVQQWEGMQFQGSMLSSSSKNAAFHTTFAKWSKTRKLVLGLADGNFACWDLESNETFISRKHFAGKHKNAITCGAWGFGGDILALGSKNQIKVSEPLLNASWEATSAKLELLDNDLALQELEFSPSGQTMSAIAGTSIFRHLCLYGVKINDNGKTVSTTLTPVGEMHPNCMLRP
jgi:WD40 repeat protein